MFLFNSVLNYDLKAFQIAHDLKTAEFSPKMIWERVRWREKEREWGGRSIADHRLNHYGNCIEDNSNSIACECLNMPPLYGFIKILFNRTKKW